MRVNENGGDENIFRKNVFATFVHKKNEKKMRTLCFGCAKTRKKCSFFYFFCRIIVLLTFSKFGYSLYPMHSKSPTPLRSAPEGMGDYDMWREYKIE